MNDSLRRWKVLSITALLILTLFLSIPSNATDQMTVPVSSISSPPNVIFHSISWNEENYDYAIAAGQYTKDSTKGVLYRYNPELGWTNLSYLVWDQSSIVIHDVIYAQGDSFFLLGDDDGESVAFLAENSSGDMSLVDLKGEYAGGGFTAGCYDPFFGNSGTLIGVGTPYNTGGMVFWLDLESMSWKGIYVKDGVSLSDVAADRNASTPFVIAVGHDNTQNRAVAYLIDYKSAYVIQTPPEAQNFTAVDWSPDGKSLLITGTDYMGRGHVWKMSDVVETLHISYYDATTGNEHLKYAYFDGHGWSITDVDTNHYTGYYTSIALDWEGNPHISYWDGGSTHLMHAKFDHLAGRWFKEEVDGNGNVGQYSSIAISKDDNVHISYYDYTNSNLKYAFHTSSGWNIETVHQSSTDVGAYTSIAIRTSSGGSYTPEISYIDRTNKTLMWSDIYWGAWQHNELTGHDEAKNGRNTLCVSPTGDLHISYYDETDGELRHIYTDNPDEPWTEEIVQTSVDTSYNSMDLDVHGMPVIAYGDNDRVYVIEKHDDTWISDLVDYSYSEISFKIGIYGDKIVAYRAYGTTDDGLRLATKYPGEEFWTAYTVDATPKAGSYVSLAVGVGADFTDLKGTEGAARLNDIDWENGGKLAIAVGDNGNIFVYYPYLGYMVNWTSNAYKENIYAVAVKSPGSPGYGLGVGSTSTSPIISYQTYNTGTSIKGQSATPHINEMHLFDSSGTDRLNRQSDVGDTYTFFINASYELGWTKIGGIDIYAWYDFGDDSRPYNETQGKNCNFHLHFIPDSNDPVNSDGEWKIIWPNGTDEVVLAGWYQRTENKKATGGNGGSPGSDEYDYFLLYVNITLGEQIIYAPGQGWSPSANQSDPVQSFNDINSWNFNITIYDKDNPTLAKDTKYDEFGIYAYTEVSVQNNPAGIGFPGSTIELTPPTKIGIKSNVPYRVSVNISNLVGLHDSSHILSRNNVEVINTHPDADSANSEISSWTPFPSSSDMLYVWGTDTYYMDNSCYGIWSAGSHPGYSMDTTYTFIYWRITIPPNTPDDEYVSSVAIEITY